MKAHNDFIVHIPERYKQSIKTENGVEIHLDKRFSDKALANNIFEIVDVPITYDGPIKPGYLLLVDTILVHNQTFNKHGEEQNQYLIDRDKKLYRVPQSLIICYSKGEGTEFKAFGDSLVCKKQTPKQKTKSGLYIPDVAKNEETPYFQVLIGNEELEKEGVYADDYIYCQKHVGVDVRLRGIVFTWFNNRHVHGKLLKQAV